MKGMLFTLIGLGLLAAVFLLISGPVFEAGSGVMEGTAASSVIIP